MPKCSACGVFYDSPDAVELVRNNENRWVSICRTCLDKGVDVNRMTSVNVAVEEAAIELADRPSVAIDLDENDPVGNASRLLDSLRELRHANEKVGRGRSHERYNVEIAVIFSLARDDATHEAVVKDLSHGGMLIQTHKHLAKGQILLFDWKTPVPPAMASVLQGNAEVRRVERNEDGSFAVGLRFVKRQVVKGANRRRFRRYKCDMRAYYRREGGNTTCLGKVVDVSQGGCLLHLSGAMEKGEKVYVRLVGGGGGRGDLVGTVQVCRVAPRDSTAFQIGCSFAQMRIERIEDYGRQKRPETVRLMNQVSAQKKTNTVRMTGQEGGTKKSNTIHKPAQDGGS